MFSTATSSLDAYISIAERANNQLNLLVGIGSWATALLSVLVAVIAIMVGYAIWKNSKEQKEAFKKFLEERQAEIIKINEAQERLAKEARDESRKEYEKLITEQKQKLESVSVKGRKGIEKAIRDLENKKASVGIPDVFSDSKMLWYGYGGLGIGGHVRSMFCIKCGKEFIYRDDPGLDVFVVTTVGNSNKTVYCSHCGAINIPQ